MPRTTSELFVHPLFYDVLSGEFLPSSDSQKRFHTLGRLAYAAHEKGTKTEDEDDGTRFTRLFYRPSWALEVGVTISCANLGEVVTLDSVHLEAQGHSMIVADSIAGNPSEIHIGTHKYDNYLPVELGPDLIIARHKVAIAAQNFFDGAEQLNSID